MREQHRQQQQSLTLGGSSLDNDVHGGLVTVLHAPYTEELPVA